MTDWCSRPLDEIYAAVFIDATWFNPIATQLSLRPMTGQLQSRRPRPDLGAIMARTGRRGASPARTRRLPRAQNRTFCMRRPAHHTRLPPTRIRQGDEIAHGPKQLTRSVTIPRQS